MFRGRHILQGFQVDVAEGEIYLIFFRKTHDFYIKTKIQDKVYRLQDKPRACISCGIYLIELNPLQPWMGCAVIKASSCLCKGQSLLLHACKILSTLIRGSHNFVPVDKPRIL